MKVLELKGFKSLRALNVYSSLLLGLKMLPMYAGKSYEEFLGLVEKMSLRDQEKILREAAHFVELNEDEVKSLVCFVADKNGVPYSSENLGNLKPAEIIDIIVLVCLEIAKMKIDFVSEDEKKK